MTGQHHARLPVSGILPNIYIWMLSDKKEEHPSIRENTGHLLLIAINSGFIEYNDGFSTFYVCLKTLKTLYTLPYHHSPQATRGVSIHLQISYDNSTP